MRWPFVKYAGCGNDFILFDNRSGTFPILQPTLIQTLCHRHSGIGADGILLLETSDHAHYRMKVMNSDGSEAEMCGNGLRCFVKWLHSIGLRHKKYQIEVMNRVLSVHLTDDARVSIDMGVPLDIEWNIPFSYQNETLMIHMLNTGVPHAVIFVDNIEQIAVQTIGAHIRYHPFRQPKGTNVTFVQKMAPHRINVRTYERGVEKETLACGTGATAAALATAYLSSESPTGKPYFVETRSRETLIVNVTFEKGMISGATLEGQAIEIFSGEIVLSNGLL